MLWENRKKITSINDRIALEDALEAERAKAKRLQLELDEAKKKLEEIESGDCVTGRYCDFCANTGETGIHINGKQIYCCLKKVPCKHFQRREE